MPYKIDFRRYLNGKINWGDLLHPTVSVGRVGASRAFCHSRDLTCFHAQVFQPQNCASSLCDLAQFIRTTSGSSRLTRWVGATIWRLQGCKYMGPISSLYKKTDCAFHAPTGPVHNWIAIGDDRDSINKEREELFQTWVSRRYSAGM
jgi:hypothetical protein